MDSISTQLAQLKLRRDGSCLIIECGGLWVSTSICDVDPLLKKIDFSSVRTCEIKIEENSVFDTSGAWLIVRLERQIAESNINLTLKNDNEHLTKIITQINSFYQKRKADFSQELPVFKWVEDIGVAAEKVVKNTYRLIEFLGQLTLAMLSCIRHPRKFRIMSIIATLNRVGLNAVPIVALISFLIGVVLVYQGSFQLKKFGAEIYTVDLLAVSLLRELGILITAIIIAGRSGSAFAAEIGTMKLNQEIDALETFGLSAMEILVIPRVIALVIAMPMLAFLSDMIGLAGGAVMSSMALDISFPQYLQQLKQAVGSWTFWVGLIKAPVFGFIIALIGCFEGMQVHGGALSVGQKTTKAVVESIFLVIVMDAIFSVLFTKLGI